jgi:hypothetical protein
MADGDEPRSWLINIKRSSPAHASKAHVGNFRHVTDQLFRTVHVSVLPCYWDTSGKALYY